MKKNNLVRNIGIFLIVIIMFIISFVLLKGCNKKSAENSDQQGTEYTQKINPSDDGFGTEVEM